MIITYQDLVEKKAHTHLLKYFQKTHGESATVEDIFKKLEENRTYFSAWLAEEYKLTITCKAWYSDGQLWYNQNYKNGELHGNCKAWYYNGQLGFEHNYKNGRKHGSCKGWYSNGQLEYDKNYKNGVLLEIN